MYKIAIYAPNRWSRVRPLLLALRELGREVSLVRSIDEDNPNPRGTYRVNWGGRHSWGASLNEVMPLNKHDELRKIQAAGVNVPVFLAGRPQDGAIGYEIGQWMPRAVYHRAAADLLPGVGQVGAQLAAAFYVRRVEILHEFRMHIFRPDPATDTRVSIRAGMKVKARPDAHPWIRALGTGWNTEYGQACREMLRANKEVRESAKRALAACGMDFGAVDVGITADGQPIVLEINSAPGLANRATADAYARHINRRLNE